MQFLFPTFLWSLALIAIPIIIHLFYFRRYKEVYFTNVRFLKELVEETSSKNKLKNFLILISRILALAALIFAFAQPFKKSNDKQQLGSAAVSIYLDNSWSMNAKSAEISLFQLGKKKALEIINAYNESDKFQIISNDISGSNLRLVSKPEARDLLEQIAVGPQTQHLSKIYTKQVQSLSNYPSPSKHAFIISDFQQNIADLPEQIDSSIKTHLIPLQLVEENNVSIDSAYFANPVVTLGQSNKLIIQLRNYGKSDIDNLRMSYTLNGQDYPAATISIKSSKTIIDTMPINITTKSWNELSLKITDYPIQFDDSYHLCFEVLDEIKVLLVYDKDQPQELLQYFKAIPNFKVTAQEQNKLDYSNFVNYHLIAICHLSTASSGLSAELKKALESGTNVVVFPAPDLSPNSYKELTGAIGFPTLGMFDRSKREASRINPEADLFDDVYANLNANIKLPITQGQYSFTPNKSYEALVSNRDGTMLLLRYTVGQAMVYVCTSPFMSAYNDLSKSPEILIPFLFKASLSGAKKTKFSYTIGRDNVIEWKAINDLSSDDHRLSLHGPEDFIPSVRIQQNKTLLEIYDQVSKSGVYQLLKNKDLLGKLAFNDNRIESNLSLMSTESLTEQYGNRYDILSNAEGIDFTNLLQAKMQESPWWRWLLYAAILFLLVEGLLIRFFKSK